MKPIYIPDIFGGDHNLSRRALLASEIPTRHLYECLLCSNGSPTTLCGDCFGRRAAAGSNWRGALSPDALYEEVFQLLLTLPWERRTEARQELFQAPWPVSYTYGKGPAGARTYVAQTLAPVVYYILSGVNAALWSAAQVIESPFGDAPWESLTGETSWGPMNGCFLNRYDDQHQALGWHADDFEGMDHTKAVCVVSFGAEREIWWRKKGEKGLVPPEQRQLLESGSLFIMPPGMQHTHDHRIPKHSAACGPRVSLTFRAFKPELVKDLTPFPEWVVTVT